MVTVRILFYTDSHDIDLRPNTSWSVAEVSKFIKFKMKGLAQFRIDLINRHPINHRTGEQIHGGNKLTKKLLADYDELWVFNRAQTNLLEIGPQFSTIELHDTEVDSLHEWMDDGGGVLLTGDHSIRHPIKNSILHQTFLTLGRAIGHRIPRAGEFRTWEGPPTSDIDDNTPVEQRDNFNTQEKNGSIDLESPKLQSDGIPQTLKLKNHKVPHELFRWRPRGHREFDPIVFFPDHAHEGELIIPKPKGPFWPVNSPDPEVIAWAKDKRITSKDRFYPVVAVFEGDAVGVGRIVADSSFHHYVRPNLIRIPKRSGGYPEPDTPLDQIAQFYGNAAFWLAPKRLRDHIKKTLLFRVAKHPDVFEVAGSGDSVIGNASRYVLSLEVGESNLQKVFSQDTTEAPFRSEDELVALAVTGRTKDIELRSTEHDAFLGGVVRRFHNTFANQGIIDPGVLKDEIPIPMDSVSDAIRDAFSEQDELLKRLSLEHADHLEKLLHN